MFGHLHHQKPTYKVTKKNRYFQIAIFFAKIVPFFDTKCVPLHKIITENRDKSFVMSQEKVQQILSAASEEMDLAVQFLDDALAHIRAGKANVRILDGVRVEYYGLSLIHI